jgi:hypothetical protein
MLRRMSKGIGKTQQQILDLLATVRPAPGTVKMLTAVLSSTNGRPISDRQIRQAVYALEDRGLVELRVQDNPFGRAGVCVYLPGGIAEFDGMHGGEPLWSRPARPPKPEPRTLAGEVAKLARAAYVFVDTVREDPDGEAAVDAVAELCIAAENFKVPKR